MKDDAKPQPGQEKIEQAAGLLIHYVQLLGARSGMVLNTTQQADFASIATLIVDAAVERISAKLEEAAKSKAGK